MHVPASVEKKRGGAKKHQTGIIKKKNGQKKETTA